MTDPIILNQVVKPTELGIAILGIKFALLAMGLTLAGTSIPISLAQIKNKSIKNFCSFLSIIALLAFATIAVYLAVQIKT